MDKVLGYVAIKNEGEIDPNAFRLLGVSTKREDDSKIGFFGSGLKYAIAVLLREQIPLKIYSGNKEVKLSLSRQKFRDKEFDVIKVNNRLTSLTTEMGIDWKLWFAVREVYCNALDEGGCKIETVQNPEKEAGYTTIYLGITKELSNVFENWDVYFSDKREDVLYKLNNTSIHSGGRDFIVYRKGIQVHFEENEKYLFDYDFSSLEINESRVVKSSFELKWQLIGLLKNCTDEYVIKSILNDTQCREAQLDYLHTNEGYQFSDTWLALLKNKTIFLENTAGSFGEERTNKPIILPDNLAMALKRQFGKNIYIFGILDTRTSGNIISMSLKQKQMTQDAIEFLSGIIDVTYEIEICNFGDEHILGEADVPNKKILLSPKVYEKGRKELVMTIIEEYAHIYANAEDKTRRFQNFLINFLVNSIENQKNIYL